MTSRSLQYRYTVHWSRADRVTNAPDGFLTLNGAVERLNHVRSLRSFNPSEDSYICDGRTGERLQVLPGETPKGYA